MTRRIAAVAAVLLAGVAILSVGGCASGSVVGGKQSPTPPATVAPTSTPGSIVGTWDLTSGTDAEGAFTPGTRSVTLKINGASAGGQGPCNAYGARTDATTTGPIRITLGMVTDIACEDPVLNTTEARYFDALSHIRTASLTGGTLRLSGSGDTLEFTRAPQ